MARTGHGAALGNLAQACDVGRTASLYNRPQRARLSRPSRPRPRRHARRISGPPPLHRLADLLRSGRRAGQEQQEDRPLVLAQRNLLRQLTWGLPSGEAIAAAMRVDALLPSDLADIASVYQPFGTSTPLWYYVVAEAKHATGGLTLGPVGGRIVAETLIGLLRADPTSYLNVRPRFRPFLGNDLVIGPTPNPAITGDRTYTRAHFLYYAGVVKPGVYR